MGYLNLRPEQTNIFFKLTEERYRHRAGRAEGVAFSAGTGLRATGASLASASMLEIESGGVGHFWRAGVGHFW